MKKIAMLLALLLSLLPLGALAESVQAAGPVDDAPQDELSGYVIILHTGNTQGKADAHMGFDSVAEAKRRFEAAGASVLVLDGGNAFIPPEEETQAGADEAFATAGPEATAEPEATDEPEATAEPVATEAPAEDDVNESIAKAMGAAGYDAMAPGENDLALGVEVLSGLRGKAGFPLLSVNALNEEGARLLAGSIIVNKDGLRIGVFGLTGNVEAEGVTLADAAEAAQTAVEPLRGEGCDLVIALARLGVDEEGKPVAQSVAEQAEGLNVVIDATAGAPAKGLWLANGALIVSAPEKLAGIGIVAIDPTGRCAAMEMDESWF